MLHPTNWTAPAGTKLRSSCCGADAVEHRSHRARVGPPFGI